MNKPKVTVGVCVRNCAATLREAIESLIRQDYDHKSMEVIFVDDGSEDETLSVIHTFARIMDMKVRVFQHKWKGLGYTRNVVVANAQGDFILWVDGDMVLSKDYVREMVKYIEQHPEVGIAKGKQALESGENMLATLETFSRVAGRMVDYASKKAGVKSLGTGGSIYKAEAIGKVGGFDENITGYGEDFDAEYRIRKAGWLLSTVDVQFRDYERGKILWKDLWCRYWKRGYDTRRFWHKRKALVKPYKMLPPASFFVGLLHSRKIYRLTTRKVTFLLPFQYVFKMSAWCLGFVEGRV